MRALGGSPPEIVRREVGPIDIGNVSVDGLDDVSKQIVKKELKLKR